MWVEEDSDIVQIGVVLLSIVALGGPTVDRLRDKLVDFTGYDLLTIISIHKRSRSCGLIRGKYIVADWEDEKTGTLDFVLSCMMVQGTVCRVTRAEEEETP